MQNNPRIFSISPAIKNYDWGSSSRDCWVAKFAGLGDKPPFAEAWFAAHSNGSAVVHVDDNSNLPLAELIKNSPFAILSAKDKSFFSGQMPFMPKVLSIAKPLSIQLHPKEIDAQRLNKANNKIYLDAIAKDEASLTLSEVELLYGFCTLSEIQHNIETVKEFGELLGESGRNAFKSARKASKDEEALKHALTAVANAKSADVTRLCRSLLTRLSNDTSSPSSISNLIFKMAQHYPHGDRGIFFFYLLNLVKLQAGDCITIPTGTLHAFLSGELVEVMKPSDNVIRCGLTSKNCDANEIINCANYKSQTATIVRPIGNSAWQKYNFGYSEFQLEILTATKSVTANIVANVEILISLDAAGGLKDSRGNETSIQGNNAFLVPATLGSYEARLDAGKLLRFRCS